VNARIDPPALPRFGPLFELIEAEAQRLGTRALVVGGYVRDRLLGGTREAQIREVDVLVEGGLGIALAEAVAGRAGTHPPVIFERFGTAHLETSDYAVEFVSTRKERYDRNSRKPDVTPGSLRDDVMRRDFTVNALLMDWDGRVLDLTGRGLADLRSRRLVTPLEPELTFDEDPLRMLRAARFAATLAFEVDPAVAAAIRRHAERLQPPTVSMERIRDEFSKLLLADDVARGLQILDHHALLARILPELQAGKGMEQGGWHSHDVFGHGLLAASLTPIDLRTRLAGLLHDVGKPATHEVLDGKVTFIGHQDVGAVMAGDALKRLRCSTWLAPICERAHYPDVTKIDHLEERIRRLDAQAINAIRSPLTGDDLMTRTGRPAGPWIKRAKAALEDAILDGSVESDAASAWRYLESHPELLRS